MNKEMYLNRLSELLLDMTEEEREEALQYYRDYFEEAGPEREEEIIRSLGSPEKVAAEIKCGLSGDETAGEFTETGYQDERFAKENKVPDQYAEVAKREGRGNSDTGNRKSWDWSNVSGWKERLREVWAQARSSEWGQKAEQAWRRLTGEPVKEAKENNDAAADEPQSEEQSECGSASDTAVRKRSRSAGGWILLLLVIFIGLPLAGSILSAGFSLIAAIFGGLIGILGGIISLSIGSAAMAFAAVVTGIALIITGLVNMMVPAVGIMGIGTGFLFVAAAILLLIIAKWGFTTVVPGVIRFCVSIVGRFVHWIGGLFRKGGAKQ